MPHGNMTFQDFLGRAGVDRVPKSPVPAQAVDGCVRCRVRTLWCETLGIPPDTGSLLRLPPLLDGGNAPLWGIAPAKTRGQSEQRSGIGRDTQ
eukprot:6489523-Prymnesium_polylepis.1